MTTDITSPVGNAAETKGFLGEDWFDPLEAGVRTRIRSFIEELLEAELEAALGRTRYERGRTPEEGAGAEAARSRVSGHRHGHRERTLMGTTRSPGRKSGSFPEDLDLLFKPLDLAPEPLGLGLFGFAGSE